MQNFMNKSSSQLAIKSQRKNIDSRRGMSQDQTNFGTSKLTTERRIINTQQGQRRNIDKILTQSDASNIGSLMITGSHNDNQRKETLKTGYSLLSKSKKDMMLRSLSNQKDHQKLTPLPTQMLIKQSVPRASSMTRSQTSQLLKRVGDLSSATKPSLVTYTSSFYPGASSMQQRLQTGTATDFIQSREALPITTRVPIRTRQSQTAMAESSSLPSLRHLPIKMIRRRK